MTSANPGQVGEPRFEQPRGLGVCAAGEGSTARREATVLDEVLQSTDPSLHEFVIAGRCFGKGRMQIGEGETGLGKMPARVCGDLPHC